MVSKAEEGPGQDNLSSSMEIILLGTGTSQGIPVIGCTCRTCLSMDPRDKRTRTAAFIQSGETGIAIDLGPDFRAQMLSNRLSNVHAVLLTHEHNDHISGLDDLRPINFLYRREIPLYGSSRTLLEMRRRFIYAFDPDYYYPGKPRVTSVIINDEPFHIGDLEIIPIPVDHGDMPVFGFRIGDFAYVTDAKTIPGSSRLKLKDLKVLVLNALRFEPHETHLTISEAITLAEELKPEKCYLTHLSHDTGMHEEVEKKLPEGVHLGYDGLRIRI